MKKYSLPKEFGDKWVEALRSGEYKQEIKEGCLRHGSKYCCLGVGIAMFNIPITSKAQWISSNSNACDLSRSPHLNKILNIIPIQLQGTCATNELVSTLSNMNDSGKSFPEIAGWIVENVEFV